MYCIFIYYLSIYIYSRAYSVHVHRILISVFSFSDPLSDDMNDAKVLVNFVVQLCDTNTMKTIAAESLMMKIMDVERTLKERRTSYTASCTSSFRSPSLSSIGRMGSSNSCSSVMSVDSMDDIANVTFLDFLMDFVTQFEFPEKIVTFLLHLLPNADYKVHATRQLMNKPI